MDSNSDLKPAPPATGELPGTAPRRSPSAGEAPASADSPPSDDRSSGETLTQPFPTAAETVATKCVVPEAPSPDRLVSAVTGIESKLATLGDQLSQLNQTLNGKAGEGDRDAMLKELHHQLQEARAGVHWKILRTVLVDLVKLYDDLARLEAQSIADANAMTRVLASLRQDVEDILYRQGFSPFQQEGDRFDGKRQQPVAMVESESPEAVGTIVSRIAPGFASDDRILRLEKVSVFSAAKKPRARD